MSITSEEYQKLLKKPKKNKYNATPTEFEGFRYDSKKEAAFAQKLRLLQDAGKIKYFLRQVSFHLSAKPRVTYRCDFMVANNDGHDQPTEFFEVKGFMTDTARVKIAMTEKIYGVKINIV